LAKTNGEQAIALKISKEKFEGQLRAVTEQLEMVTRSHD
jgi:DNA-binding CsgD family transcriptional regulator